MAAEPDLSVQNETVMPRGKAGRRGNVSFAQADHSIHPLPALRHIDARQRHCPVDEVHGLGHVGRNLIGRTGGEDIDNLLHRVQGQAVLDGEFHLLKPAEIQESIRAQKMAASATMARCLPSVLNR